MVDKLMAWIGDFTFTRERGRFLSQFSRCTLLHRLEKQPHPDASLHIFFTSNLVFKSMRAQKKPQHCGCVWLCLQQQQLHGKMAKTLQADTAEQLFVPHRANGGLPCRATCPVPGEDFPIHCYFVSIASSICTTVE